MQLLLEALQTTIRAKKHLPPRVRLEKAPGAGFLVHVPSTYKIDKKGNSTGDIDRSHDPGFRQMKHIMRKISGCSAASMDIPTFRVRVLPKP